MNIGYSELLTHLNTKFLARRSDIIVSSTLSITLTPTEDKFVAKKKGKMTDEEVVEWVNKRQEFRAHFMELAELPKRNEYADRTLSMVSYVDSDDEPKTSSPPNE